MAFPSDKAPGYDKVPHRQPKLTVCFNSRVSRFTRLCMGTPGSGDLQDFVNPLDFSKKYML